jgi:intraflagellar transport protein 56
VHLLKVQSKWYRNALPDKLWLCRCLVKNKRYEQAWDLYAAQQQLDCASQLLQIIATDAFELGGSYFSMRAFQLLAQSDPEPYFKEGLIAAAVGLFRKILSRTEPQERLQDVINALSGEPPAQPQLEVILRHADMI